MYFSTKTPVLLQTTCIKVRAPGQTTPMIQTRVLLDSCSQRSYISSKLCNELGLEERKETLLVKTFEGRVQACRVVNLSVMTRAGTDMGLSLLSIPTICEPLTEQPITYATSRFQYLSGLDLADSGDVEDSLEVGALIGVDQYWKIVTGKVVKGSIHSKQDHLYTITISYHCTTFHISYPFQTRLNCCISKVIWFIKYNYIIFLVTFSTLKGYFYEASTSGHTILLCIIGC